MIFSSLNKNYRLNKFVIKVEAASGTILYNTTTGGIVCIKDDEDLLNSLEVLAKMFFIVPVNFDEVAWVNNLRTSKLSKKEKREVVTSYTILTTSDCNARCFYCYEKGVPKHSMSQQTAIDIANFIVNKSHGRKVALGWFGGEPLLNTKVIDVICEILSEKGVEYRSSMISNGLLFSSSVIEKAKQKWNLKNVQITLDGTKEVYLKAKSFLDEDGKEFDKVIENIDGLTNAGIKVSVRINQDLYNTENLKSLVVFLCQKFGGRKGFSVYNSLLYNDNYDDKIEKLRIKAFEEIQKIIIANGLVNEKKLNKKLKLRHCMADSDSSLIIMPNGSIGICEHYLDQHIIGTIYDSEYDINEIAKWKDVYEPTQKCFDCPLYPQCVRIKMCPEEREQCSYIQCENKIELIKETLLKVYDDFKLRKMK